METTTDVDDTVRRLVARSVEVIATHQAASGAYPACEEFSAYRGYCWYRDGSFIADAMSRATATDSASRFHDWCAGVLAARRGQVVDLTARHRAGDQPELADMLPTRFTFDGQPGSDPWWDFQLDGYGTWLWAVHDHATRHDLDLARWAEGIEVACDYLVEFWNTPCYDWWEEHAEQRHGSTLGALYAGLMACAGSAVVEPGRRALAAATAADIKAVLLSDGLSADGHLTKWLGTDAVDGSLAACIVPFGVVEPGSPIAEATLARIERDLCVDGGVHRFVADVFYGGGQWPLLTCFLGWNHASAGRPDRARELFAWAAGQADDDGLVPEQVPAHLLHPDHREEWLGKWGPVAKPLLWSHAMILTLADQLGYIPNPGQTVKETP